MRTPRRVDHTDLVTASVAPIRHVGRLYWATVAILGVIVATGVYAFIYQFSHGLGVTGMNDKVFWGLYEADLVTFIGFSYGGALVSAILRLTDATWRGPITRIAEGTALVALLVGATFPVVHLGHPERVWELFLRPQINSPLFWDMVAILTYLLATFIMFTLPLIPDLGMTSDAVSGWRSRLYRRVAGGWTGTPGQRRTLNRTITYIAILIVPLAVMVHTVLSYAFSLTSRPGWKSTVFGPYFVIGAVYSGVAVVILAVVAYRRAYHLEKWIDVKSIKYLSYLMAALAITYGYFLFTEVTSEGYVAEQSEESVLYSLILQRYSKMFWTFVILGLLVPLVIVAIPKTRTVRGITIAAALAASGMWLKRFLIVVPALTRPLVGNVAGSYRPTRVEVSISLAGAAAIPLLLMLLFRLVPVLSVHDVEDLAEPPEIEFVPEGAPPQGSGPEPALVGGGGA